MIERRIDYTRPYLETLGSHKLTPEGAVLQLAEVLVAAVDDPKSLPFSERTIAVLQRTATNIGLEPLAAE